MSMKADFNLVVGAERALSYEAMREDLNDIIGKLNKHPYKIKLRFDMASASKDVNKLRSDLKDLSQKAADIKFSDRISNSLSGITASLKTLTDSITGVAGLKEELLSLSEAMRSFQGINLNIGLSGGSASQRSAAYGVAARDTIAQLRERATQMEQLFAKYYGMNDRINAVMNSFRGTNILEGRDIFSILGNKDNTSLSYTKQMDALREYINLLERAAAAKNIDFSSVSNSFNASANEVVSSTQKILTGEQQIESGAEKIRSIFGSGINSEALISKLEEIRLSIDKITESLTNLNTKEIKLHFDETELNEVKTQIAQLLAEMSSVTSNGEASKKSGGSSGTKKGTSSGGGKSGASTKYDYSAIQKYYSLLYDIEKKETDIIKQDGKYVSASGKWDKYAASLNNAETKLAALTSEETKSKMSKEELLELTNRLTAAEEEYGLKTEDLKNKQAKTQATKEAAQAERNYAAATREANAAQKAAAQAIKAAEITERNYVNAITQGESALKRYSAAEHSHNQGSRTAYQNLVSSLANLKNAEAQYGRGSKEVDAATKVFRDTLKSTQATLTANGDATQSLTVKIGGLAKKFGSWLGVSQVIMYAYRSIKKMISVSIELDSAMTQMQIVTKAASDEMKNFGNEAAKSAQKTASSITDIVDSATTYARLGYDIQDSTKLAEYTAMLQNVGDIDVSDAQDAITSIIKAYGKDADEIESIMDKLVETGNNFPISVSQIAEGMNNASSTLAASGNTFEQSVALLTAANTTIQDAAKSSTGLRTIAARIRNTKTELDDLGETMTKANYEELVSNLTDAGVSLTNINGEYRSTYEIMSDIAAKWDEMSNTEQAAMATALSGTRQQAVFYSIIEQFKEASGAMDAMAGSAGALDRAYSTHLDSTQAHVNQLKAKFEELSMSVMDSNSTKAFIDTLGTILDRLNDIVNVTGALPPLLATISGYLSLKKNFGRTNMFVLYVNMPKAVIVPFGYERFRYCGCCDTVA